MPRVTSPPTAHDNANRLLSVTDPLGNVESYTYDLVGNRVSSTNPRGGVTTFVYDAKDRLVNTIDPLGQTIIYTLRRGQQPSSRHRSLEPHHQLWLRCLEPADLGDRCPG